jgi:hypothetical protein
VKHIQNASVVAAPHIQHKRGFKMSFRLPTVVSGLVLLASLASVSAQAQQQIMPIDVPFQFTVAGSVFPSGHYVVTRLDGFAYAVRGEKTGSVLTFKVDDSERDHPASLVFANVGSRYILTQIWVGGGHEGKQLIIKSFGNRSLLASAQTVEVLPAKSLQGGK